MVSSAFAGMTPLPEIRLDDQLLAVRRVDDTTLAARLPDLPGIHQLRIVSPDIVGTPTPVDLFGFDLAADGPHIQGHLVILPGPPAVVGSGDISAVVWHISQGTLEQLPESIHSATCGWGVGPSYDVGSVVFANVNCLYSHGFASWSLRPQPTLRDSLVGSAERFAAELAPGLSIYALHHEFNLIGCDSVGCGSSLIPAEEPFDVLISPRGDRVAGLAYNSTTGTPILGIPGGGVAYSVPLMRDARDAVFSPDGDTLFLAGVDSTGHNLLLVLHAGDGQVLDSVPLRAMPISLGFDPSAPWFYVFGTRQSDGVAELEVWDRGSLAMLAAPAFPGTICAHLTCLAFTKMLPSPLDQHVYIVGTWYGGYQYGSTGYLVQFGRPPT